MPKRTYGIGLNAPMPIEKHVPLPQREPSKYSRYQWDKMELGDSFLIPFWAHSTNHQIRFQQMSVGAVLARANREHQPRVFTQRTVRGIGVRVWRIR
jgi:hypothetical protein